VGLQPVINPREKILLFGMEGTGKSNAILNCARYIEEQFHVYDSDYSFSRLLATDYVDVAEKGNVDVFDPAVDGDPDDPWGTMKGWVARMREEAGTDDWVAIDSLTPAWDDVQAWFTEQAFGADIADYFIQVRKALADSGDDKKGNPLGAFEGFKDWPSINKEYARRLSNVLLRMPCHLIVTCEQSQLGKEDQKDLDMMGMYGQLGVKPKGQKRNGHIMSTVIWMQKARTGVYRMTTVKDRGRAEMSKMTFEDFAMEYLVEIAGWEDR